jgi:hypothetical protein
MSDKASLARRIVSWALCAAMILCALAFTLACVQICRSGDRPFTPESIASAWQNTAIFFYITIVLSLAAGVLHILYPAPAKKQNGTVSPKIRLAKIKARLARKQYADELLLPLIKHEVYLKSMRITAASVCILCAAYPLIYLNNLNNFTETGELLNAQILDAVIPTLCFTAAALLYCIITGILADISCEKAILYAKSIMLLPAPAAEKKPRGKQEKGLPDYTIFVLRSILLVTAVCLIVAGILNGSVNDVLQKAIKICTECIGLG